MEVASPHPQRAPLTPCAPASAAWTSTTRCCVTWADTAALTPTATPLSSQPRFCQRCMEGRSFCWPDFRGWGRAGPVAGTVPSTAWAAEGGASGPAGVKTLLATPCLTLRHTCRPARTMTPPARTMRAPCARWRRRVTERSTTPAGGFLTWLHLELCLWMRRMKRMKRRGQQSQTTTDSLISPQCLIPPLSLRGVSPPLHRV